jgi:hypothetical protein
MPHFENQLGNCAIEYAAAWSDQSLPCGRRAVARCADCGTAICRIASWNAAGSHSAASATTTIWRMYAQRSPSKAISGIKKKLRPRKLGQKVVASQAVNCDYFSVVP